LAALARNPAHRTRTWCRVYILTRCESQADEHPAGDLGRRTYSLPCSLSRDQPFSIMALPPLLVPGGLELIRSFLDCTVPLRVTSLPAAPALGIVAKAFLPRGLPTALTGGEGLLALEDLPAPEGSRESRPCFLRQLAVRWPFFCSTCRRAPFHCHWSRVLGNWPGGFVRTRRAHRRRLGRRWCPSSRVFCVVWLTMYRSCIIEEMRSRTVLDIASLVLSIGHWVLPQARSRL